MALWCSPQGSSFGRFGCWTCLEALGRPDKAGRGGLRPPLSPGFLFPLLFPLSISFPFFRSGLRLRFPFSVFRFPFFLLCRTTYPPGCAGKVSVHELMMKRVTQSQSSMAGNSQTTYNNTPCGSSPCVSGEGLYAKMFMHIHTLLLGSRKPVKPGYTQVHKVSFLDLDVYKNR